MKIIFFGDVVGKLGRRILAARIPELLSEFGADLVLANGENAAGGVGIEPKVAEELFSAGVDVLTTGNHVWNRRDIFDYLEKNSERIIRPINYPSPCPGRGWTIVDCRNGQKALILNAIGRVFMTDLVDCPFRSLSSCLDASPDDVTVKIVDFHAEASSEKAAMGHYLDGRVSLVVGTHTHVLTADGRILENGTAYITDAGMCGPCEGVIGVRNDRVLERFLSGRPVKFDTCKGRAMLNAVLVEIDDESGEALSIDTRSDLEA